MNESPSFIGSKIPPTSPKKATFHVIPVPLERSATHGIGTSGGPAAILDASQQLETFNGHNVPSEQGIHTYPPIACDADMETVLGSIEQTVGDVLDLGSIPIMLGGEHTISIGAFHAVSKRFDDVGIIQFDAHADLRPTKNGTPYDHACVMSHALDLNLPFLQIGVRSISQEEMKIRNMRDVWHFDAQSLAFKGLDRVFIPDDFPQNVYVTFDVDALDSSIMPATGTPEPGGLMWYETLSLLKFVSEQCNVIGFDMVELAPIPNMTAPNYVIARLIHEFMGMLS